MMPIREINKPKQKRAIHPPKNMLFSDQLGWETGHVLEGNRFLLKKRKSWKDVHVRSPKLQELNILFSCWMTIPIRFVNGTSCFWESECPRPWRDLVSPTPLQRFLL